VLKGPRATRVTPEVRARRATTERRVRLVPWARRVLLVRPVLLVPLVLRV
jgi:hypothetical protein